MDLLSDEAPLVQRSPDFFNDAQRSVAQSSNHDQGYLTHIAEDFVGRAKSVERGNNIGRGMYRVRVLGMLLCGVSMLLFCARYWWLFGVQLACERRFSECFGPCGPPPHWHDYVPNSHGGHTSSLPCNMQW